MGGDGTMLGAARHLAPFDVPVVGINHGRLGFITDIPVEAAQVALTDLLQGRYETEKRMLLSATVWRGEQQMYTATALNDVVLNRAGRGRLAPLPTLYHLLVRFCTQRLAPWCSFPLRRRRSRIVQL
jgi:NAD kinase